MNATDEVTAIAGNLWDRQVLSAEPFAELVDRLSSLHPLGLVVIVVFSLFAGAVQGIRMMSAASRVALPFHLRGRSLRTEEQKDTVLQALSSFGIFAGLVLLANLAAEGLRIQIPENPPGMTEAYAALAAVLVVLMGRLTIPIFALALAFSLILLVFVPPHRKRPEREVYREDAVESPDLFTPIAREHDEHKEEWGRWHTDLDLVINYSAIHDVQHEDFAAELVEASEKANDARAQSEKNPSSQAAADRFQRAVDRFSTALDEGVHQAKLLGTEDIDPALRRVVMRAQTLLATIRHESTTRFEKENAARALYAALKPIVGAADGVADMPELETAIRRELVTIPQEL